MARKILNYCVTYTYNGEDLQEIYFSKLSAVNAYTDIILRGYEPEKAISDLKIWEIYAADIPASDITDKVNRFLRR